MILYLPLFLTTGTTVETKIWEREIGNKTWLLSLFPMQMKTLPYLGNSIENTLQRMIHESEV
jgi:hypothetical protein